MIDSARIRCVGEESLWLGEDIAAVCMSGAAYLYHGTEGNDGKIMRYPDVREDSAHF